MKALFLAAVIVKLIPVSILGVKEFRKWQKSGFCKHEWKIYDTLPYGQKHWYKCKKCDEKRLR